jgi:hypothetical protein
MFDQIEKLKQDLTDQYVVVNTGVPELRRFEGYVGQVKTVNMNGRALVQFEAWANIGWYDIEVDFLKVVPKPEAGAAEKKHEKPAPAAKPAATGEKKLSALEMARMQGAAGAAKPAAGAAKPAAAKPAAAKPAAGGKKSTADILAAARAKAAPAAAPAEESAAEEPVAQEVEEAAPATAVVAKPKAAAKPAFTPGQRPSVPEILAWCREHDTK